MTATQPTFASDGPSVAGQIQSALALRSSGMLTEAADLLASPGEYSPYLCAVRAEIEFALGRFQDAALSYFAVTLAHPDDSDAQFNLALCLKHCGRWDVAAEAFQRVLQLDTDREDARLGLGACLLHLNHVEEALAIFTQCESNVNSGPALLGEGVALQLLGRFEEALATYSTLLASDPNSEEALSNLIAIAIETNDLKRVLDHSARLLAICPRSKVALQGLVMAAFGNSDYSAAAFYCDQLLELAPESLEAWHNFRIAMDNAPMGLFESAVSFRNGGRQ